MLAFIISIPLPRLALVHICVILTNYQSGEVNKNSNNVQKEA